MAKLFQILGVLAVLGIGAGGMAGAMLVKDRLRVEIYPDAPKDDGLAIVRDDLKTMQADLQALTQVVGEQLGQVGQALGKQDESATSGQQAVLAAIASLERAVAGQGKRLDQFEERIAALAVRAPAESTPAPAIASEPVAEAPKVESPVVETPKPEAQPEAVQPSGNPATEPKAAKKGGFGFALPSRTFRFDQAQNYEIVADLSRVGFDAKSTLHDFSGVTSKVAGTFTANFADPKGAWTGSIACEAASLVTGVDGRDEAMREHLDTPNHKEIRFAIESFTPSENGIDAAKMTCEGTVQGTMTIRGKAKALAIPVKVRVDESRRVIVEGQTKVHLPDFEVPVPSQLGLISMEPDVVVWVALRARVQKAVANAR